METLHNYAGLPAKQKSWVSHQAAYNHFKGRESLPENHSAVSMCGIQDASDDSQINWYIRMGFMKKLQYVGLDNDAKKIAFNQKAHGSGVRFLHCFDFVGGFSRIIDDIIPGFVDLDTIAIAGDREAIRLLTQTMFLCVPGTVLAFNVQIDNRFHPGRSGKQIVRDQLRQEMKDSPGMYEDWTRDKAQYYDYTSKRTRMGTFVFHYRPEGCTLN